MDYLRGVYQSSILIRQELEENKKATDVPTVSQNSQSLKSSYLCFS